MMILEVIRKRIKERRIKYVNLCKDLDISPGHFSQFINGKVEVGYFTIEKLLTYLDLEIVEKKD